MLPAICHILERGKGLAPHSERKIGLVVQGGCMRGVFTAGALCGLEELGVRRAFDAVYASSGGAVNAGYFLSGQIAEGTSIYYSDINNRAFVDFRRIFKGTAIDIDFCFDEVVARRKRLHLDRILQSPTLLKIYVTHADGFRTECFAQHELDSADDLLTLLKASAAMPLVYRKRISYRGNGYFDGGLLAPVPLLEAIEDGCTDILALLSRPLATAWAPPLPWVRGLLLGRRKREARALARAAWQLGQDRLSSSLSLLRSGSPPSAIRASAGLPGGVQLAAVSPAPGFPVTRWTTDRRLLVNAAFAGAGSVLELFEVDSSGKRTELSRAIGLAPEEML